MMTEPPVVEIDLRQGERLRPLKVVQEEGEVLFCSGSRCPHWKGQVEHLFPLPDPLAGKYCDLVGYPARICSPYYLEEAELRDGAARDVWEALDAAEAFERCREHAAKKVEVRW